MKRLTLLLIWIALTQLTATLAQNPPPLEGLLYPRESPSRERKDLSGVWNFRPSPEYDQQLGFREQWYLQPLQKTGDVIPMPVPSSFNDITQDAALRDYLGWVWYDTEFYVPSRWRNGTSPRIVLYFGSAHYNTMVWLNGISVVNHSIGHLPFQAEVSSVVKYGFLNRVTVALNNTLTSDTVPQGSVKYYNDTSRYPPGFYEVTYNFDFMNYAGIHRPVYLYTTPATYIEDITIRTDILSDGTTGIIYYDINYVGADSQDAVTCYVEVSNKDRQLVAQTKGTQGNVTIPNAQLWWPYLMNPVAGYMYTITVRLVSSAAVDYYHLPVGIRTVGFTNTSFLINGQPFYFRGFGKHEDYDIRGKGVDMPTIIKDFNLIKWVGANSFRTSHYPYADEIMDRADAEGIVVIEESPACTLKLFGATLLENHKRAMAEMIRRDKNRPSVVMWSMGNEPDSSNVKAGPYFGNVSEYTRTLDTTRPITLVLDTQYYNDQAAQYLDVLCVNRYDAWYSDTGYLKVIQPQMVTEYTAWHETFNKPVLTSEYGADSVIGLHTDPPYVFTEDYQVALMVENFKAFDTLRQKGFFYGEMIWNFADFMTPQEYWRPTGCLKGLFTRQRQPKAAAHLMQARYWDLARREGHCPVTMGPEQVANCPAS